MRMTLIALALLGGVLPQMARAASGGNACLALTIYQEARGEPARGKQAVGNVLINRARREHRTLCSVLVQAGQFQWTKRGPKGYWPRERAAWTTARRVANDLLHHRLGDITHGALFFYDPLLARPRWARRMRVVRHIGHHLFLAPPMKLARR